MLNADIPANQNALLAPSNMEPQNFTPHETEWPGAPFRTDDRHFVIAADGRNVCRTEVGESLMVCSLLNITPIKGRAYRVFATGRMIRLPTNGLATNFQAAILGLQPDGSMQAIYAYTPDPTLAPLNSILASTQVLVYDGSIPLSKIKARVLINDSNRPPDFSDAQYELLSLSLEDVTDDETNEIDFVKRLENLEGNSPLVRRVNATRARSKGQETRIIELERKLIELDARSQSYISSLNVQIGSLLQIITPLMSTAHGDGLVDAREAMTRLRALRRGLRERQAMPIGQPGPCEGIRIAHGSRPILFVVFAGLADVFGVLPHLSGLECHVIYLMDATNSWYVNGLAGAPSIPEMVAALRSAIAQFEVEKVIFFGQSMGAYAALRFAPEFNPDLVAVFGPQTHYIMAPAPPGSRRALIHRDALDIRPIIVSSKIRTHIWVALSENENRIAFWDDYAHLEGLETSKHISIHKVNIHQHSIGLMLMKAGRLDAAFETIIALATDERPPLDPDALL